MLDAVENSIRDMLRRAAARACDVPAAAAHIVGEVAAEDWHRRCLPADPAERALWLRGALAVLPLIPARSPDPAFFSPGSSAAVRAAREMIERMYRQAAGRQPAGAAAVELARVPAAPAGTLPARAIQASR